jgi:hypothetical protein
LNAHPDLAGKLAAAKRLTAESTSEQASAGLDALTDAERSAFTDLNTAYTAKFGFPFIIAVRDHDKAGILAAFRRRIDNDRETEFAEACRQVERIAELRLLDLASMSREITIAPLTAEAFAPFGEVLEATGTPDKIINQGLCGRFHDVATLDIMDGRPGISLFKSEARSLPYQIDMVERHPLGSQAFLPMGGPVPRDRGPRRGRHTRHAAGVPHRTRPGHQLRAQHLARCSHAAQPPGLFRGDRPDRRGRNLEETLVRSRCETSLDGAQRGTEGRRGHSRTQRPSGAASPSSFGIMKMLIRTLPRTVRPHAAGLKTKSGSAASSATPKRMPRAERFVAVPCAHGRRNAAP